MSKQSEVRVSVGAKSDLVALGVVAIILIVAYVASHLALRALTHETWINFGGPIAVALIASIAGCYPAHKLALRYERRALAWHGLKPKP